MSRITRNKLSVLAWSGAVFCALWLLVSAQAAVDHTRQTQTQTHEAPCWTVDVQASESAH